MPSSIDPRACVDPKANLGKNVTIGPFAVVEDNCFIADNVTIKSHATVRQGTTLGPSCIVGEGAIIAGDPQDLSFAKEKKSFVIVEKETEIREFVTIHRASKENAATIIGENCLIMVGVHIAHDVVLGSRVVIANLSQLSGHIVVGDDAFISGNCLFHQNVRIGRLAMISAQARISRDVLPFSTVAGYLGRYHGINAVGLRRHGFDVKQRTIIKNYYQRCLTEGLEKIKKIPPSNDLEKEILDFILASKRGVNLTHSKEI